MPGISQSPSTQRTRSDTDALLSSYESDDICCSKVGKCATEIFGSMIAGICCCTTFLGIVVCVSDITTGSCYDLGSQLGMIAVGGVILGLALGCLSCCFMNIHKRGFCDTKSDDFGP